jgi:hypothetical protein
MNSLKKIRALPSEQHLLQRLDELGALAIHQDTPDPLIERATRCLTSLYKLIEAKDRISKKHRSIIEDYAWDGYCQPRRKRYEWICNLLVRGEFEPLDEDDQVNIVVSIGMRAAEIDLQLKTAKHTSDIARAKTMTRQPTSDKASEFKGFLAFVFSWIRLRVWPAQVCNLP